MLGGSARSAIPASEQQQRCAYSNGADTSPQWYIDPFFFLYGHVDRANINFVRFLGVAEAPVYESQCAGCNQDHGDDLYCVHWSNLPEVRSSSLNHSPGSGTSLGKP